jgi:hypothetical protein
MVGDPRFISLLKGFDLVELEIRAASVYGMWPDLTLAYFNQGWQRFAAENEGEPGISQHWGLGCNILDAIDPALREYYRDAYARCLRDLTPWEHLYECSSPTLYRRLQLIAYPIAGGEGILVVNATVVEQPHDPEQNPPQQADEKVYRDEAGVLRQCCHCRRTQRARAPQHWDLVPEWIRQPPPRISHVICPICADHFYPQFR